MTKTQPARACARSHCLTEWPPLNVANANVPAPFGTIIQGNNGKLQLTVDGLPLYYYDDDKKPGDTTGNYPEWHSIIVNSTLASTTAQLDAAVVTLTPCKPISDGIYQVTKIQIAHPMTSLLVKTTSWSTPMLLIFNWANCSQSKQVALRTTYDFAWSAVKN